MSTLLETELHDSRGDAVGSWLPSRYTPSLGGGEEFDDREGRKLLRFVDRYWHSSEGPDFALDEWQEWLIRHVLERYPADWPDPELAGQLRFRQVVISLGRQNGKSVIAAVLALYLLALHVSGPRVVGLASVARQAQIVYQRVKFAIDNDPALSRDLRTTDTRGIHRRDGTGIYQVLPADEDSAQGEPISGCLYDELHLGLAALWDAMVIGQGARQNSLLVGITTAGDDDSDLLINLYDLGAQAIEGGDERFGFFVWEAPSDDLTEANVIAANPAVACGRKPLSVTMRDASNMWTRPPKRPGEPSGRDKVIRYVLNRFTEGSDTSWAPIARWNTCEAGDVDLDAGRPVFGAEVTDSWEAATITVANKVDRVRHTEVVASILEPTYKELRDALDALASTYGAAIALDAVTLSNLGKDLREAGHEVWILTAGEMQQAAANVHASIVRRRIVHPGDQVVREQFTKAKRRTTGDAWRISRSLSTGHVDSVISTLVALYVADLRDSRTSQLF